MNNILYFFTKALAAGISLAKVAVRSILPNLYTINQPNANEFEDIALIYAGNYPNLYPQAYGEYLDSLGYMFGVTRLPDEDDDAYRQRILFGLSKNSTPSGIENAIVFLLRTKDINARVNVINNFDNFFDAETSSLDYPLRDYRGSLLYSINIFIEPEFTAAIDKNEPIYYTYFENVFNVDSFQMLLDDVAAAGIRVESVTFLESGASGAQGESYAYST